jgi:capsular exopolysaccharide synthesis family protein
MPYTLQDLEEGGGLNLKRLFLAVRRYWWIMLLSAITGAGIALMVFQSVSPRYQAEGAIWINTQTRGNEITGPIAQGGLLESRAWIELLTSYAVLDPVVLEERLYLNHPPRDSLFFSGFKLDSIFYPGAYRLVVGENGIDYTLFTSEEMVVEEGRFGGPVGANRGFIWAPSAEAAALLQGREVNFSVMTPRDAARNLGNRLTPSMDRQGQFLRLLLSGRDPVKTARTLNAVMHRHVEVAADLKRNKLDELTSILKQQLDTVEADLREAEQQLESYQVQTITLPSEETSPIVPGLEQTRAPVFGEFFQLRVNLDALQIDRANLEEALAQARSGDFRVEAFERIPAVRESSQLRTALTDWTTRQAELRALREDYTDEWGPVADLINRVGTLEEATIPGLAQALIDQLSAEEQDVREVLDSRADELSQIPPRAIEENRRQRNLQIQNNLYIDLQNRYATASLAAASSIPDLTILDEAAVPRIAANDPRIQSAFAVFFGALAVGFLIVLLLDRFDPKLRDPADIGQSIGLEWLGAIPRYRRGTVSGDNSEELREAFRDLRMKLDFAFGAARPLVISVTSPSEGEGKTFVSANLANAFADLGRRTVLVDGDTRRGDLHHVMGRDRKPGLTDFLMNGGSHKVIQSTENPKLNFVGFGSRTSSSPELLNSSNMQNFLAGLKRRYEVIIFDSPPMAAGSDPFVLGAHTGNVVIVLRSGSTHKELAAAKMESFLRLPVRILGAVLNDFAPQIGQGYYRYYSHYLPGYEASDEEQEEAGVAEP